MIQCVTLFTPANKAGRLSENEGRIAVRSESLGGVVAIVPYHKARSSSRVIGGQRGSLTTLYPTIYLAELIDSEKTINQHSDRKVTSCQLPLAYVSNR